MRGSHRFSAHQVDVSIPAAKVGDDASRSQGLHDTAGVPLLATGLKPPSVASSSASLDDGDAVKDPWIVTELRDTSPRWSGGYKFPHYSTYIQNSDVYIYYIAL